MAFAVPAWKTYAVSIDQVSLQRYEQVTLISLTGLNTDVAYDLDDTATPGTFYTSAEADGTHGAKATALKAHLLAMKTISAVCSVNASILGVTHTLYPGAPSSNEHMQIVSYTTYLPDILFNAGGAPTAWLLILRHILLNSALPRPSAAYGTI